MPNTESKHHLKNVKEIEENTKLKLQELKEEIKIRYRKAKPPKKNSQKTDFHLEKALTLA